MDDSLFGDQVHMSCEARIGTERIVAQMSVHEEALRDGSARRAIEDNLRFNLAMEILKKWKPVITERRG